MKRLHKHIIDPTLSLKFFKKSLGQTNLLSIETVKYISKSNGKYCTLLPAEANLDNLNQFSVGILPDMPIQRGPIGSLPGIYNYSVIPNIGIEFCRYMNEVMKDKKLSCVIDDFNSTYNDEYECELFDQFGIHYKDQVYYYLDDIQVSEERLLACFQRSNTFWHSLCLLTKSKLNPNHNREVNAETIKEISRGALYAIVGAYDGEGYIFWEKDDRFG
ncbi:MAG: hypothetical protein JSS32_04875 [Verrucomicrobia bacterium]|nr:hypothetical protein [Verrucomicrobiota bacterium]